jgi:hypothetical protein
VVAAGVGWWQDWRAGVELLRGGWERATAGGVWALQVGLVGDQQAGL